MALNPQSFSLPSHLTSQVEAALQKWVKDDGSRRLWGRDASLWTGADEDKWLGWLDIVTDQASARDRFEEIARDVRKTGFTHVLLLGMGGSSLCPDVLGSIFSRTPPFPKLLVLDSTDPGQIRRCEQTLDIQRTLLIVSSKSGTTLESTILLQYFLQRVRKTMGPTEAGRRFLAITDPGSRLQGVAEKEGFRGTFFGRPDIGGRFSALSDFGMVPAAVMGLDVSHLLSRTEEMVRACAPAAAAPENPGVVLGTVLGAAAKSNRDKITIVASPPIASLGAWLEQLLAESTGKQGQGLIPVDGEALGPPGVYGQDRLFVYLKLRSSTDEEQDHRIAALERADYPIVRIELNDSYDIGQEFFRWEMATAVAGSFLGVNPFDQPDVDSSKVVTRRLTAEFEEKNALPARPPILEKNGLRLFVGGENSETLEQAAGPNPSLIDYLRAHLGRLGPGDYFAILAYVPMNRGHENYLQEIRHAVRDRKHVATCLGFGPRFMHSTGQGHKGGPNTGVFLQITCDDAHDLPVPGKNYTFGVVKSAQARGDLEVLETRRRRVLRVHIGESVGDGLRALHEAVVEALNTS